MVTLSSVSVSALACWARESQQLLDGTTAPEHSSSSPGLDDGDFQASQLMLHTIPSRSTFSHATAEISQVQFGMQLSNNPCVVVPLSILLS